jgi:hypothetical protein
MSFITRYNKRAEKCFLYHWLRGCFTKVLRPQLSRYIIHIHTLNVDAIIRELTGSQDALLNGTGCLKLD